jgi:hypothetical protein
MWTSTTFTSWVEAPHAAHELGLGQHLVGVATERDEQVELGAGQVDRAAVAVDAAGGLVDDDVADLPRVGGELAAAPQQRADPASSSAMTNGLTR